MAPLDRARKTPSGLWLPGGHSLAKSAYRETFRGRREEIDQKKRKQKNHLSKNWTEGGGKGGVDLSWRRMTSGESGGVKDERARVTEGRGGGTDCGRR